MSSKGGENLKSFKKKILSESMALILLLAGLLVMLVFIAVFIRTASAFSFTGKADTQLLSQYGDIVSGVSGSLWALAGVILFFVALESQKESYQLSREALDKQVEALNEQISEAKSQGAIFTRTALAQEKTHVLINEQLDLTRMLSKLDLLKSLATIHADLARIEEPGDIRERYKKISISYAQELKKTIKEIQQ